MAKALAVKAKTNPKLRPLLGKLTGKDPRPLTKSDLATLKSNLPSKIRYMPPVTPAEATNLAGMATSPTQNPPFKNALSDYLAYGPAGMSPRYRHDPISINGLDRLIQYQCKSEHHRCVCTVE